MNDYLIEILYIDLW